MSYYRAKPDLFVNKVAEECVLFRMQDGVLRNNTAMVFNEAGTYLWECLKEKVTRDSLVQLLSAKYGIDAELARTDVDAFLAKCLREDLIFRYEDGE